MKNTKKDKGEERMEKQVRNWKGIGAKERTDILKAELDDFSKQIITNPEKLEALAKNWRKGFHSYSFYNLLSIYLQNPKAQLVAGKKTWEKKHKRSLKDGEYFNALWVLAPIFKIEEYFVKVKIVDKNNKPILDAKGNETFKTEKRTWKKVVFFKSVPVYDINQTKGKELNIGMNGAKFNGGSTLTFEEVVKAFPEFEIKKVESISDGSARIDSNRINVANRENKAQEIASLFHELGHHLCEHTNSASAKGRFEGKTRKEITQTMELEAECVAYLVCTAVGIEQKEGSSAYIGSWKGNQEKIERSAYRVLKVAGNIIKRLAEKREGK